MGRGRCSEAERLDEPRLELRLFALVIELSALEVCLELIHFHACPGVCVSQHSLLLAFGLWEGFLSCSS